MDTDQLNQAVFSKKAGFCSIVAEINPLSAAHLFVVTGCGAVVASCVCVVCPCAVSTTIPCAAGTWPGTSFTVANCAKLLPNRSISVLTTFSFLFNAPGLVFKLLCLTLPMASCNLSIVFPLSSSSLISASISPSTSPKLSRFVFNFLEGRLLRFLLIFPLPGAVLAMRLTKALCLMVRLSFFESMKESDTTLFSRCSLRGSKGSARRLRAFSRAERRLPGVGAVGA